MKNSFMKTMLFQLKLLYIKRNDEIFNKNNLVIMFVCVCKNFASYYFIYLFVLFIFEIK
jgi:hypothetical protein